MITKRWSTRLGRISSQNYTICNDHYYAKCDIMNVKYIKISFKSLSIYVVVMFLFAGFDYK